MEKNNGAEKENIFRKMYNALKENDEEKKRVIEKIKNDKGLHVYVMDIYYIGWMFSLFPLIMSVNLIFINEIGERLVLGIGGIVFSVMMMVVYYVSLIKPLKK